MGQFSDNMNWVLFVSDEKTIWDSLGEIFSLFPKEISFVQATDIDEWTKAIDGNSSKFRIIIIWILERREKISNFIRHTREVLNDAILVTSSPNFDRRIEQMRSWCDMSLENAFEISELVLDIIKNDRSREEIISSAKS